MKQFLGVFVAIVLLFSLSACTEDSGENGSNDNSDSNPVEQPMKGPSEKNGEEPSEGSPEEPLVFTKEQALELEEEFEERLYQETIDSTETQDDDSDEPIAADEEVRDFDSKEELLDLMAEIMDRDLASNYIDTYYREENDKLYLIPTDGPIMLVEDEPYELEEVDRGRYKLTQQVDSRMIGLYTLTITYQYEQEKQSWIIADREVERQ